VVTVNGEGFGTHDPSLASSNGPAEIRLGSATGQVLATAAPSGTNRAFSVPITVPAVAPGDTVLVATQKTSSGTNVFGTPARTVFTVTAPPPPPGGSSSGLTSSGQTVSTPQVVNTTGSSNNTAASRAAKRAKAVAACKKKYNPSKAKSRRGKRSVARKRASCISKANKL
jgi:hypothetical protein